MLNNDTGCGFLFVFLQFGSDADTGTMDRTFGGDDRNVAMR